MTVDEIASDVLEELRFDTDEASRAETVTRAIRAALAARDAETREVLGRLLAHASHDPDCLGCAAFRALLSEGKP